MAVRRHGVLGRGLEHLALGTRDGERAVGLAREVSAVGNLAAHGASPLLAGGIGTRTAARSYAPLADAARCPTRWPTGWQDRAIKIGLFFEHQLPRPWDDDAEATVLAN